MDFETFIKDTKTQEAAAAPATPNKELTPDEIIKEFAPYIAADQLRRANNGEHI